jgi:hypothetical protein
MTGVLGTSLPVFLGVTLVLAGGAAHQAGHALSLHWRPRWQVVFYMCLLAWGARFVTFALFEGVLVHGAGYVINAAVLTAIALLSYQRTRARYMVRQYPWLYEPDGLLGWRERAQTTERKET